MRIYGKVTVTIIARATRTGQLSNVAGVSADQRDPNLDNNLSAATVRILATPPPPPPPTVTG